MVFPPESPSPAARNACNRASFRFNRASSSARRSYNGGSEKLDAPPAFSFVRIAFP